MDPERVQGGVEASFSTLVTGLAAQPGLDLHVISFVPGLREPSRRDVGGVSVDYLPTTRRLRSITFHIRERRALSRRLAELRPDLVHAQDAVRHGFICLKAAGTVPVVISIHGIARAELRLVTNPVVRLRMSLADIQMERYCIRTARYLVQPTRYPERYFGDEIRGRIWDVGNPISGTFFDVDPDPEPGRMMYSGAIIPRKRLLDLVEALPTVVAGAPNAALRVIGFSANPDYLERVHQRLRALQLEDRVTFLRGITSDEMLDEYRRASVLVLPSDEETSPMVIGEAMAAGVPVVATRVGGVTSLVDEGRTGHTVEPGDVGALAERICEVLGDPAAARALGNAGREKADKSYRVAAVAGRVRAVYDQAVEDDDGLGIVDALPPSSSPAS